MGRSNATLHGGGRADRRGAAHEEDHVGTVLVGAPEVLQILVYRRQGTHFLAYQANLYIIRLIIQIDKYNKN